MVIRPTLPPHPHPILPHSPLILEWTTNINQRICQADRLVDVDWRIDVQLAASHKDNR